MPDFSNTELRRLDLTLLLVLLGLIRRRKASAVARELGLTQSGVSQALRRLRDIFGDALFLRRPHGMEPTATALALEAPVAAAVEALRGALGAAQRFEPATAAGVIRLAALDAEQAVLVPALAARLRHTAPGLALSVLPLARRDAVEALMQDRVALAIGFFWERSEMIASAPLYEEGFLVAGPPQALPDAHGLTLERYLAAEHILVSPGGDLRGVVDVTLEGVGQARRVVLALSGFLPALAAAAETGAFVTLPRRVASRFAAGFGLATAEPPLAIRSFPVSAFWHRRNDRDARHLWLREQVRRAAAAPLASDTERSARAN